MKITYEKFSPYHWGVLVVAAIVLMGAVYASTTWDNNLYLGPGTNGPRTSQLPDQSHASGLQAQPGGPQLNSSASSESLQAPAPSGSAPSTQATPTNNNPPNPDPCRGADPSYDIVCQAP